MPPTLRGMIRAVLFDLDGLLVDSESLHCRCWQETLAAVGTTLNADDYFSHWTQAAAA